MKMREKILSILLVLFIAGVNFLTACGQNPSAQTTKPESSALTVSSKSKAVNLAGSKSHPTEPQSETELGNEAQNPKEGSADPDSVKPASIKTSVQNKAGIYPEREADKPGEEPAPVEIMAQVPVSQTIAESPAECIPSDDTASVLPVSPEPSIGEPLDDSRSVPDSERLYSRATPVWTDPYTGESDIPQNDRETNEPPADDPQPQHTHSYAASRTEPSCTTEGYTLFFCACGDSYRADETPELGHDWEAYAGRERVSQEAHEICGDCGLDLTANGISGAEISAHAKNHVLSDDNATGRTYTAMIDIYEEITRCTCRRCGTTQ